MQGYSDLNCPFVKQTFKVISIRLQFSGGSSPWDKGGGGVSSRPWDKMGGGGGLVSKKFFWPFGPQFGLKKSGGWPPPLDPPLQLCLCHQLLRSAMWITTQFCPHSVLLLVFLSSKAVSCCCCYFPCWT